LRTGGFAIEAAAPAREAVELALSATAIAYALVREEDDATLPAGLLSGEMLARSFVSAADLELVRDLRANTDESAHARVPPPIDSSAELVRRLAGRLPP
jgi:hypothetical protein